MKSWLAVYILFLTCSSYNVFAESFKTFWVCGTVFDVSGKPMAGKTVEVLNTRNTGCDPRYLEIKQVPGSSETTNSQGEYKVGIKIERQCNYTFLLRIKDATHQLAHSPEFIVDMVNDPYLAKAPASRFFYPAASSASAGIDEATVHADLHCRSLVGARIQIRREDGKDIGNVRCSATQDSIGPGIGLRWTSINSSSVSTREPISSPSVDLVIPALLPSCTYTFRLESSDGSGVITERRWFGGEHPIELMIPSELYKDLYLRVEDQEGVPVSGVTVDFVYNREDCYSFCSEHDYYTSGKDGRITAGWGTKWFMRLIVMSVPEGYEILEAYSIIEDSQEQAAVGEIPDWEQHTIFDNPYIIKVKKTGR